MAGVKHENTIYRAHFSTAAFSCTHTAAIARKLSVRKEMKPRGGRPPKLESTVALQRGGCNGADAWRLRRGLHFPNLKLNFRRCPLQALAGCACPHFAVDYFRAIFLLGGDLFGFYSLGIYFCNSGNWHKSRENGENWQIWALSINKLPAPSADISWAVKSLGD